MEADDLDEAKSYIVGDDLTRDDLLKIRSLLERNGVYVPKSLNRSLGELQSGYSLRRLGKYKQVLQEDLENSLSEIRSKLERD